MEEKLLAWAWPSRYRADGAERLRCPIEHARYFTVNDLAAMMSMQYDNQGLARCGR
jgi:hypothetical protein